MILLFALVLALAAPPARPTLLLSVYPPIQIGHPGRTSYVRIRARLDDPRREYHCPELTLDYGDGCRSIERGGMDERLGICDPYGLESEQPTVYRMRSRQHPYRESGRFTVTFTVRAYGAKTRWVSRDVLIGSGDGMASLGR